MIRGMHSGDLRIDEDGRMRGMVNGRLTIAAGRTVRVSGMVNGPLIVEKGANVHVSGQVNGGIDNRGGTVTVTGLVSN